MDWRHLPELCEAASPIYGSMRQLCVWVKDNGGMGTFYHFWKQGNVDHKRVPELQLQIVEFAREHGRVTIGEAIKLTGASRNTLKQHFRTLVERDTLNQHGSGRGVWYDLR